MEENTIGNYDNDTKNKIIPQTCIKHKHNIGVKSSNMKHNKEKDHVHIKSLNSFFSRIMYIVYYIFFFDK